MTPVTTAQAVAHPHGLAVQTHTGLRERCFGRFEGQTWAELEARFPEETLLWRQRAPESLAMRTAEATLALRQGKAPVDTSITDAELEELRENFPLQYKVVVAQRELERKLAAAATGPRGLSY